MILSQIKYLNIKYKVSIGFSLAALVLSIMLGLISGNKIGSILVKSGFMTVFFFVLGFLLVFVLQKYIPELYAVFRKSDESGRDEKAEDGFSPEDVSDNSDLASDMKSDFSTEEPEDGESFEPLSNENYSHYSTAPETSEKKLGKHFISGERKIKYEPKLMADAIRTMLKKDEK